MKCGSFSKILNVQLVPQSSQHYILDSFTRVTDMKNTDRVCQKRSWDAGRTVSSGDCLPTILKFQAVMCHPHEPSPGLHISDTVLLSVIFTEH